MTKTMKVRVRGRNKWVTAEVLHSSGQWCVIRSIDSWIKGYKLTHKYTTRGMMGSIRSLAKAKRICDLLDERFPKFRTVDQVPSLEVGQPIWDAILAEVRTIQG